MSCVYAVELNHHIFTDGDWRKVSSLQHPMLTVKVSVVEADYHKLGFDCPNVRPFNLCVVADSGAQSCLWSRAEFHKFGFSAGELIPVRHTMKSANRTLITIDGAIIFRLSGCSANGKHKEAAVIVYISPDVCSFYLSKEAMVQLGIIPVSFPQVGAVAALEQHPVTELGDNSDRQPKVALCGCFQRNKPPGKPDKLPFSCTSENVGRMKQWLLSQYADSTFNKCPHQVLPDMDGPPMRIHLDNNAKLVNFTTPASVPLHWKEKVKRDLDRDVDLGVIEKVPYGEPTVVCHRMLIARKADGDPRRVVDMSPTNKYCHRETYPSESPFHLARSVPSGSIKTVFDAWNGFHSIRICEEDQYLTTFITEWGLYRYIRGLQGFLSSGDGYNRRVDEITRHFIRLLRCIDDSLVHDVTLEEHWWRVIEFLEMVGNAGIALNPEKFQFSQETVDFAGFRITKDSVLPLPKYVDSIQDYPTPSNISDIRSWFGLVNQVSHYSQLRNMMVPFRKFLSPKVKFEWTDELAKLFLESKSRIVEAIKEGVKIFDVSKRTCLSTDYSKTGIGFWLLQKHCSCVEQSPKCCTDGWKITLAGSRFLSDAERNYVAIEGEALAVAWGLEQTRYFTLGCNDLLVLTDHKPLVKILGDRTLEEINNPRLFRLKQRTMMWKFDIEYHPGKFNATSDALSRNPNQYAETASMVMQPEGDELEGLIIAALEYDLQKFSAITLQRVGEFSKTDESLLMIKSFILNGFPASKKDMPEHVAAYWEIKNSLSILGDVILYKDRVIIPTSLREHILHNVHSAHQGVTGMNSRAEATFFWPGISADLGNQRMICRQCHKNAPSQPKPPPVTNSAPPKMPFEKIFADYFHLQGNYYLVIGDRLSGWPEVVQVKHGTHSSGAKGLRTALRRIFATFGVPEEMSSDGGPEFEANESNEFYRIWGTKHRLSSAHFPQSNGRAEAAVKAVKRLLECNIGPDGTLDTDRVVCALLQLRNTPDRDCKLSPAQILFGRPLRDSLPHIDKSHSIFDNVNIHNYWREMWKTKEAALRFRAERNSNILSEHSKPLQPLIEGDIVLLQNQCKTSPNFKKWDRQGVIVTCRDYDQYLVRTLGTGRLTLRNRRFLKALGCRDNVTDNVNGNVSVPTMIPSVPSLPSVPSNITQAVPTMIPSVTSPPSVPINITQTPSMNVVAEPTPISTPSSPSTIEPIHEESSCRRSTRLPKPRKLYNASTGVYEEATV